MIRSLRTAFAALLAGAAIAASPPAKAETVIVGVVGAVSATHWPVYIGLTKGYFAAEDLKLDLVFVQSSAALVQQLTAGSHRPGAVDRPGRSDPRHRQGRADRDRAHRDAGAALCPAGQARHQELDGSQGQDHLDRRPEGHHPHLSSSGCWRRTASSPATSTWCSRARPRRVFRRCKRARSTPRSCCRRSISMRRRRASPISASPSTMRRSCRSPARWSTAPGPRRTRRRSPRCSSVAQQEHGLVLRSAEPRRGDQDHGRRQQAQGGGRREGL